MSQHQDSKHIRSAFAMSGTYGQVQLGVGPRSLVTVMLTGREYDTAGILRVSAAVARIPATEAYRLHEALGRAIVEAETALDTRQSALWSPATTAAVAARFGARS